MRASKDVVRGVGRSTGRARFAAVAVVASAAAVGLASLEGAQPGGETEATSLPPRAMWQRSEVSLKPVLPWVEVACGDRRFYQFAKVGSRCLGNGSDCIDETLSYYPNDEGSAPAGATSNPFVDPWAAASPWAAVLDWDSPHGWSMGSVIRELSARKVAVALYDLGPHRFKLQGLTGVTDVHVLAAACTLLDQVDHGLAPPTAVNMSFGRLARADEKDGKPCASGKDTLSCEIHDVLGLLGSKVANPEPGTMTLLVAASGNYGDGVPMVPAVYDNVVDVGANDVAEFRVTGDVVASWESPSQATALFPGSMVCAGAEGSEFAAPAGSSTAAAVFSGVMADLLVSGAVTQSRYYSGQWRPEIRLENGVESFLVTHRALNPGTDPIEYEVQSNQYQALLSGLSGSQSVTCFPVDLPVSDGPRIEMVPLPTDPRPQLSLPQAFKDEHDPQPSPMPCGACPGAPANPLPLRGQVAEGPGPLPVDLAVSLAGGVVPAGLELVGLNVRVGTHDAQRFYGPDPEDAGSLSEVIKALQEGGNPVVVLEDLRRGTGESFSLILILHIPDCSGGGDCDFWVSSPIALIDSGQ